KPAELQPRRGGLRALLDQVEREGFRFFIALLLLKHLEPVDDGASGTDEIVADPRAEQCGEIESIEGNSCRHADGLREATASFGIRTHKPALERERESRRRRGRVIHRGRATCQGLKSEGWGRQSAGQRLDLPGPARQGSGLPRRGAQTRSGRLDSERAY